MPVTELAGLPDGRLTDMVAERLFGFVAGNLLAHLHDREHRRQRQCDGAGRSARLLRHGARRRVPRVGRQGASEIPHARARPSSRRRSGVPCSCSRARSRSSWRTRALRSCCFRESRCLRVFVLRHSDPSAHRPFKALGYPVAPARVRCCQPPDGSERDLEPPGAGDPGLAIIAAGVPLYLLFAKRKRRY